MVLALTLGEWIAVASRVGFFNVTSKRLMLSAATDFVWPGAAIEIPRDGNEKNTYLC